MAVVVTLTGAFVTDVTAIVKQGSLRVTRTVDGSQGTCNLILMSYATNSDLIIGSHLKVADGATTYFDGRIRTLDHYPVTTTKWEAALGCQDDSVIDATTSAASFGLSDTPNGTTTFGYQNIHVKREATGQVDWYSSADEMTLSTWKAGLVVGQTVAVTNSLGTIFRLGVIPSPRILKLTTVWPTLQGSPRFDLVLAFAPATGLVMTTSQPSVAFPSPRLGIRSYRTDHKIEYFHDGTRWLSTQLFAVQFPFAPIAATTAFVTYGVPQWAGSDIWLETARSQFMVAGGGTALGASHKWVGVVNKRPTGNTQTAIATHTVDSGASAVIRTSDVAINALLGNGTTYFWFDVVWTKTGTPGTLAAVHILTYRLVAT